jgi:predicted permease
MKVRAIAMMIVHPPYAPGLGMMMVPIVFTVVLCTAAVVVFALVGRFAKNPIRTYIIISSVFLAISFLPDLAVPSMGAAMPGASWGYAISLMTMHVVAGFITVYMLIKLTTVETEKRSELSQDAKVI